MTNRELPDGFLVPDEELPNVGIDRMRADDELYQHAPENPAEWAQYRMAEDGLPTVEAPLNMPYAPPLTPETLCCLADTSKFVLRGQWGEIIAEFDPDQVERMPDGRYRASARMVGEVVAAKLWREAGGTPPNAPAWRLACRSAWVWLRSVVQMHFAPATRATPWWSYHVEVEPIRPQCRHFARQMTDFQDEDEHVFMARLCTARRDDGGEFLSVRDSQVFACDMRDPVDRAGVERADSFDAGKIELGRKRVEDGDGFDVDAALEQMTNADSEAGAEAGGIFKTAE